jgi:GTP cyclohydrolase I
MDHQKIEKGVRLILEGVGENPAREGLRETPQRVAEMFEEILEGVSKKWEVKAGISEKFDDDIIIIKDIPFYSMCEHHLLPFFGKIHLGYLPKNNKVAGFSSITRLINIFARRLQIQERLTHQIADSLMRDLDPRGVVVIIEAQQLCVSMRGSKKDSARTITQAIRGDVPLDRLSMSKLF